MSLSACGTLDEGGGGTQGRTGVAPAQFTQVGQNWEQKLKEGYAVVIMTAPYVGIQGDSANNFIRNQKQFAFNARWDLEGTKKSNMQMFEAYSSRADKTSYEVIVLPAGTYVVNQFRAAQRGVNFNEKFAAKQPKAGGVGTVDFSSGQVFNMISHQIWQEPQFEKKASKRSFCSAVIAGTTQCVSGGYVYEVENVMTQPGGNRPMVGMQESNALGISVNFQRPLASFKVEPGEVILIDGLVAELPATKYGSDACMLSKQKTARCELSEFHIETYPAQLDAFLAKPLNVNVHTMGKILKAEKLDPVAEPYTSMGKMMFGAMAFSTKVPLSPNMMVVLQRAKYKPLTMGGVPSGDKTNFGGKGYVMRAGK